MRCREILQTDSISERLPLPHPKLLPKVRAMAPEFSQAKAEAAAAPAAIAADFAAVTLSLFAWRAYEPAVKCDLSSCAFDSPEGLVFFDPIGLAEPALARLLHGRTAHAVILTNGNHARAAGTLRERFGVKIFAPRDADGLELVPDETLADGQIAPGGFTVVALPGAGPGEIALVGNGTACIGDALIRLPPEGLRILPAKYCTDAAQLRQSLRKLLSCEFQAVTFAHGAPLVTAARRQIEHLLA
jgi:hypothetical protein